MLRAYIVLISLFFLVGCEKKTIKVVPKLDVKDVSHFRVDREDWMEWRSERGNASGGGPSTAELTVRPDGDEVHFIWSDPAVEPSSVVSAEQVFNYLLGRAGSEAPPSFVVSNEGRFIGLLDEQMVRAEHRARLKWHDQNPDRDKQLVASSESEAVALATDEAEQLWNEMGGAFLSMNVTLHPGAERPESETVEGPLGKQKVIAEKDCATGRCWVIQAGDQNSDRPLTPFLKRVFDNKRATMTSWMSTVNGTYNVKTMLPVEVEVEHVYGLEIEGYEGLEAIASRSVRTSLRFEVISEAPKRAVIAGVSHLYPDYKDKP